MCVWTLLLDWEEKNVANEWPWNVRRRPRRVLHYLRLLQTNASVQKQEVISTVFEVSSDSRVASVLATSVQDTRLVHGQITDDG